MKNKSQSIANSSKLLKALSNKKRLSILFLLKENELCVSELEKFISLSQSALSQHLAILRKENIVKTRRKAQTIFYSIKSKEANKILASLEDLY